MIAAVCITSAAVCRVFDCGAKEYGVLLKTAAAAGILMTVITAAAPIFQRIERLYGKTGADSEYLTVMFKAAGICYLTRLASDICKDSGEGTLASQAELAGKIALLVLSLPLFEKTVDIISSLIC